MSSATSPEITRAAERYLEQYGDPLVMNTYLKVTILVLCIVCLTLAALIYKSQRALQQDALKAAFLQANQFRSGYNTVAPSYAGAPAAMLY